MAKRRASKTPTAKKVSKRPAAKKTAAKKASKTSSKKSAKRAPAKKVAPKKVSKTTKRAPARKKSPPPTAYERRDKAAKAKGYHSYWDERQSRTRARKALAEIGHPNPNGTDPQTLRDVDDLGTLGRGESARELYYKTKRILERYQPAPSDRQIWSLIRIFYKPRGRR